MEEEQKTCCKEKSKRAWLGSVKIWQGICAILVALFVFTWFFDVSVSPTFSRARGSVRGAQETGEHDAAATAQLAAAVLPKEVILPVVWGNFGKQMIDAGVIDGTRFESLYEQRGGLNDEERALLYGDNNGALVMNQQNSGNLLNLLWAFGLANKNAILEQGPMQDKQYGGAGNFASTGGWSLAKGDAMDHYSKHAFVSLTPEQHARVESVSKNIYRPCCGNSVYFPDCNHGMAMLGLLELMAAAGVSEQDMYEYALLVNSYWFPDTYMTIAKFMGNQGVAWKDVPAKDMLGAAYSSSAGFKKLLAQVEPVQSSGGGGCGV